MKLVSLAAAMIAFALTAGQASAQLPRLSKEDEKAILCISESFTNEEAVAVAFAEIDGDEKAAETSAQAMLKGAAACKATLKGDQRRIDLAENVAIEEAIIDVAVAQLKKDGMTESGSGLFDVWSALSRKDQDYFLAANAPDDLPFRARMKPLLVKAGIPDKEQDIDGGMLIMECISNLAAYYRKWMEIAADTTH